MERTSAGLAIAAVQLTSRCSIADAVKAPSSIAVELRWLRGYVPLDVGPFEEKVWTRRVRGRAVTLVFDRLPGG